MQPTRKIKPTVKLQKIRQYWLSPILKLGRPVLIRGLKVDNGWYDMQTGEPILYSNKMWRESKIRKAGQPIMFKGHRLCPHCKRFSESQSVCPHCKNYVSGFFAAPTL